MWLKEENQPKTLGLWNVLKVNSLPALFKIHVKSLSSMARFKYYEYADYIQLYILTLGWPSDTALVFRTSWGLGGEEQA